MMCVSFVDHSFPCRSSHLASANRSLTLLALQWAEDEIYKMRWRLHRKAQADYGGV